MYAAASLANGGSFDDIQPGLDFFGKLKKNGNYMPGRVHPGHRREGRDARSASTGTTSTPATPTSSRPRASTGRSPCPTDGQFAQYYSQAINKDAPHPAAARLWQEYLYSAEGQNLLLKGYARPVLMTAMEKAGTLDKAAAAKLPTVAGTPTFPTEAQQAKAKAGARPRAGARPSPDDLPSRHSRRSTVTAAAALKRRRRAPGWLAVVPLLVFVAIAFGLPAVAMLDGAFTVKDPATGATSYTAANLTASLQGALPHRAARQRQAVRRVGGCSATVLGLLLAQAVVTSRFRALREAVLTASGVLANFGGVPLAFAFVATLGNSGVLTRHLGLDGSGLEPVQLLGPGHRLPVLPRSR